MLSTETLSRDAILVDTSYGFIELIPQGKIHKYLGRAWAGDLKRRGQAAVDHRISCAWLKFHSIQSSLMNRNVNIKLRLKLFDTAVSPCLLYALETCPLTNAQLEKIETVKRKMLRKIVGWVRIDDESWQDTGSRMKQRLESALSQFYIEEWSSRIIARKEKLLSRLESLEASTLSCLSHNWSVHDCAHLNAHHPGRHRGHPCCRWYDVF